MATPDLGRRDGSGGAARPRAPALAGALPRRCRHRRSLHSATRAALVGLDLETAEALLASTEYADEVRLQHQAGEEIRIAQLPTIVIEHQWTLDGVHSQNDYVQALSQIYSEWKAPEDADE